MSKTDHPNKRTIKEHIELYKEAHERGLFPGVTILEHEKQIVAFLCSLEVAYGWPMRSAIDWGCGKAKAWSTLAEKLGLERVFLYDPALKKYRNLPSDPQDIVICCDVLEHIPEHLLKKEILKILTYAEYGVFFSICLRKAGAKLKTGEQAHATIKPASWWLSLISQVMIEMDRDDFCFVVAWNREVGLKSKMIAISNGFSDAEAS